MKFGSIKSKRIIAILATLWFIFFSFNYLPEHEFAFRPTPQNGQLGGINGIFVHEEEIQSPSLCIYSYGVIQLFNDGTVLGVTLCLDENIIESWSDIETWFNRNTKTPISRGKYYVSGKQIWFSIITSYNHPGNESVVVVDYLGTFSKNKLILDLFSHYNGHKETDIEYFKIDVEQ